MEVINAQAHRMKDVQQDGHWAIRTLYVTRWTHERLLWTARTLRLPADVPKATVACGTLCLNEGENHRPLSELLDLR